MPLWWAVILILAGIGATVMASVLLIIFLMDFANWLSKTRWFK